MTEQSRQRLAMEARRGLGLRLAFALPVHIPLAATPCVQRANMTGACSVHGDWGYPRELQGREVASAVGTSLTYAK